MKLTSFHCPADLPKPQAEVALRQRPRWGMARVTRQSARPVARVWAARKRCPREHCALTAPLASNRIGLAFGKQQERAHRFAPLRWPKTRRPWRDTRPRLALTPPM